MTKKSSTKTYPAMGPAYQPTPSNMTEGQRKTIQAAARRNGHTK